MTMEFDSCPAFRVETHVISVTPCPVIPEPCIKMAASPKTVHKMAANAETFHKMTAVRESRPIMAVVPESRPIMATIPEFRFVMAPVQSLFTSFQKCPEPQSWPQGVQDWHPV